MKDLVSAFLKGMRKYLFTPNVIIQAVPSACHRLHALRLRLKEMADFGELHAPKPPAFVV